MILITGGKGFIGNRLLEEIPDSLTIDLKDGQNLLTIDLPIDVDIIYHLAAQTSVEASWHDPVHDMDNLRMTARIAHAYPQAKIIYANSCAAIEPKTPYGFSKRISQDYLKTFHKNTVNLIFPNIYGPGSKSVVDIFKNAEEVPIFGDGESVRDFVHLDDIVRGLLKAQNWPVGDYFMGSGVGTKVKDLTQGKPVKWLPARIEEREVIVRNTTPNWKPILSVKEYLS